MVLTIGMLRSLVEFKVNVPVSDGAGYKDTFFDFGQTRGYLKVKGGGRSENAGEIESNNSYDLYVRYQPYYARVDLRIVIDGRNFTIDTVDIVEEGRKEWLRFSVNEKK
jgi:hypothetical protein